MPRVSLHPQNSSSFSCTKYRSASTSQLRTAFSVRSSLAACLCLFGIAFTGIVSGTEAILYSNLTTHDGLPQGGVQSFEEDSEGVIWFGTSNGLRRFDGYELKAYGSLAQTTATTRGAKVVVLDMLKFGHTGLLVATGSDLKTFDLSQGSSGFQTVSDELANGRVLLKDPNADQVYVGTRKGVYKWSTTSMALELVVPGLSVTALSWRDREDDDGPKTMLLGTNQGEVLSWMPSVEEAPVHGWSCAAEIVAMCPMPDGTLWVGSEGLGLYQLDGDFQEVARHLDHPEAALTIPHNHITALLQDRHERLWVGTKGGLARYDRVSSRFDVYEHDPSDERSLGSNEVQALFEDRRGVLWIGHRSGVSRFGLDETWFGQYRHRSGDPLSLGHDAVYGLSTTPDNTLWVGTAGGLFAFQATETGRVRAETHPALRAASWNVSDLFAEDDGSLWIGTRDEGLQHWNPVTSTLTRVAAIPGDAITALAKDEAGNLWVGTRNGLASGNLRESFKTFQHEEASPASLKGNVVTALYAQPNGPVHVGTEDGGVQVYSPETGTFENLHPRLTSVTVTAMAANQQGHLWIGTLGYGLFVHDPLTLRLEAYHTENSDLPNNDIQGILMGKNDTVWLSTNEGLASSSAISGRFRVFDTDDGLASLTFHRHAYAQDRAGRLYFGGDRGFSEIDIDRLPKDKIATQAILTGLEINGVKQEPGEANPYLKKAIGNTRRLDLSFDPHRRVGLTFATLDYTVPARSVFRYRLLPSERNWTNAGRERRASYTGLQPNTYKLQVQSSLDGARWNLNSAEMEIRIPPPWYLTWWFLVSSVLLSLGVVVGVVVSFSRKRHQRALRDQEVLENERNKAEAALADELQRTMVLHSATETSDNANLYKVTLEHLGHYFRSSYGGIYEVLPEEAGLQLICESYARDTKVSGLGALSHDHPIVERILAARKPIVVSDVKTDMRIEPWRDVLLESGLEALLILRTMNQREASGFVIVGAEQPTEWRTEDIRLMETVASQIGRSMLHHQLLLTEQLRKSELERARHAAESANQAKSDFLAKMTHELRTPLNSIIGFTQLLEEDQSIAPDHRDTISIINGSGNHLLETVNGILDMSKIEQGQAEFNPEAFDLDPFIKEVLIMMRGRAESSGLTLIEERSTSLPTRVVTDKVKLRQVLINFIGNSIKFTESGGITLRLRSLGPASDSKDFGYSRPLNLQFEVIDTGCGIDEDEIPRLFERFSQTASGRQSGQGTGLGLPISKNFVELMGGSVRVESKRDHGTTFAFDILCDEVPSEGAKPTVTKPIDGVPQLASGSEPFRILIAEDQLPNRLLLRTLLTKAGFEVIEAENGKQAVEKWRETNPDLIFMDNDMPFMTGLEATRMIIEEAPVTEKPSIIFLSAFAIESYRQEALQAGCIDYLTKPFDKHDLFKIIAQHTEVSYC